MYHDVYCATLLYPLIPLLSFLEATTFPIDYTDIPHFTAFHLTALRRYCMFSLTN